MLDPFKHTRTPLVRAAEEGKEKQRGSRFKPPARFLVVRQRLPAVTALQVVEKAEKGGRVSASFLLLFLYDFARKSRDELWVEHVGV